MSPAKLAKAFTVAHLQAKLAVIMAAIAKVEAAISEQESRRQLAFFDLDERIESAVSFLSDYGTVEFDRTVSDWQSIPRNGTEVAARNELEALQARADRFSEAVSLRKEADAEAAEQEVA